MQRDAHDEASQPEAAAPDHPLTRIIDRLAPLLPAQGPISTFIHHNPLHAFEQLPFEDAVEQLGPRAPIEMARSVARIDLWRAGLTAREAWTFVALVVALAGFGIAPRPLVDSCFAASDGIAVDVELAVAEGAVGADRRATDAIHEARTVTQRALGGVRDLSQLLRPSMLDDFGLPDTLKWYLRKFSDRTGVRTELVEERLGERLPIDVEVCVYRVVQEALTNVSRHAQASACRVFVQRLASSVIVTVEDDGVGLPVADGRRPEHRDGLGLVGIRERVSSIGGTFRIEGKSGKGTRLTIEVPLTETA